jgi:hypothetical protein
MDVCSICPSFTAQTSKPSKRTPALSLYSSTDDQSARQSYTSGEHLQPIPQYLFWTANVPAISSATRSYHPRSLPPHHRDLGRACRAGGRHSTKFLSSGTRFLTNHSSRHIAMSLAYLVAWKQRPDMFHRICMHACTLGAKTRRLSAG